MCSLNIKILRILILIFFLISCEKDNIHSDNLNNIRKGTPCYSKKDTRVPLPGLYEGEMLLKIPGYVDSNQIYTQRIIKYLDDENIYIKWCSKPDTFAIAYPGQNFKYIMTFKFSNNSCGEQDAIFDYYVNSTINYNELFEYGEVRYR